MKTTNQLNTLTTFFAAQAAANFIGKAKIRPTVAANPSKLAFNLPDTWLPRPSTPVRSSQIQSFPTFSHFFPPKPKDVMNHNPQHTPIISPIRVSNPLCIFAVLSGKVAHLWQNFSNWLSAPFWLSTFDLRPLDFGCAFASSRLCVGRSAFSKPNFRLPTSSFWFNLAVMTLTEQMTQLARQAKAASRQLAKLTTAEKNSCLLAMADAIEQNRAAIQKANACDMEAGAKAGLSGAMLDRLKLDDKRVAGMAKGLREVAALPDPVGRTLDERTRPNGLRLQKISTPIGVVVIIYESRPNVTADAASLCFKSGNATILRGGKEAIHSNQAIAEVMLNAAAKHLKNFPEHAIQVVPTTDRDAIKELLSLTQFVDLCMPRGGEGLIRAVTECSKVPVIKHYKGVCHVYVDADADLKMAEEIVINAKCQRPGVCNAMETLLVDKSVASKFLPSAGSKAQRQ